MKLQAEAKNLNASANLSDVRSTLVDIETGLLALDEQAFKLLSQKLGLPVGPKTADTVLKGYAAATASVALGLKSLGALKSTTN